MTVESLFLAWARRAVRTPRAVLAVAAGLVVVAALAAVTGLEIRTSNLDLVDPDLPPVADFIRFTEEFGTPNVLVVAFEGDDPAALRAAVDRTAPALRDVAGVRGVLDRKPMDEAARAIGKIDPYFSSFGGDLLFIFVQPDDPRSRADTLAPFVKAVAAAVGDAGLDLPTGVRVGFTGLPQYALDDRDVIQRDISRLSLVALGGVLLLFLLAFGSFRRPILAVVAVLAAVTWTLGLTSVHPGHLTLLSAFFASILLGLGIDFGIHLVDRVEEELARGARLEAAILAAVGGLARSFATSALTTASVFFAMQLSGFKGFAELGFISGLGVLLCLVAMLTVLPALLVVADGAPAAARRVRSRRIGRVILGLQSRWLAALLAVACLVALASGLPSFDSDYLNLQPADSEAVRLERRMVEESFYSPQFAAFTVADRQQARVVTGALHLQESVGAVRSALDLDVQAALAGAPSPASEPLRRMMVSPAGRLAVFAYPMEDVWAGEAQRTFLAAMQAIDPAVTGMPFLGRFMVERSRRALVVTAALGGALLLLWVAIDFRQLPATALAIVPTLCALVSMSALMRLFELSFNPLNVMAMPVVLGIAVDDGVHMVHRFQAEGGDLRRTLGGTGRGIVLTSATTMAAFGALIFTSHRGLASFALLLTLGVGAALAFSLLLLPVLLRLVHERRTVPAARRRAKPDGGEPCSEPLPRCSA
jgi:predicted RND superfamily exporter protein